MSRHRPHFSVQHLSYKKKNPCLKEGNAVQITVLSLKSQIRGLGKESKVFVVCTELANTFLKIIH